MATDTKPTIPDTGDPWAEVAIIKRRLAALGWPRSLGAKGCRHRLAPFSIRMGNMPLYGYVLLAKAEDWDCAFQPARRMKHCGESRAKVALDKALRPHDLATGDAGIEK